MAEITVDEFQRIQIAQISAVLRGLGWSVVASDTRGDAILVTIQKPKPARKTGTEETRP